MRKPIQFLSLALSLLLTLECLTPIAAAKQLTDDSDDYRSLDEIKTDLYAHYAESSDGAPAGTTDPTPLPTDTETAPAYTPDPSAEIPAVLSEESTETSGTPLFEMEVPQPALVSSDAADFTYKVLNDTSCAISGYTGSEAEVILPAEIDGYAVTRINANAFQNNHTITSVTLPEGVTEIQYYAFLNCSSLQTVVLPDSLAAIGYQAFGRCSALTEINYPKSLSSLPGNTSNYSSGDIFRDCTSLEQIIVPEGVTFIPDVAFRGCNALRSVILPSTLTSIGNNAFDNSGITSITIPENVTTIGKSAFAYCRSLVSIDFEGEALTSLGNNAFEHCAALTSIALPDSLSVIKSDTFSACSSLEEVTLPAALTEIAFYAFLGCSSLQTVVLPDSLAAIGYQAFGRCSALTEINYPKSLSSLPGNTSNYSSGAIFKDCTSLEQIIVPEGVIALPAGAFKGCNALRSVILPSTLTSIGNNAFDDSGITSITIPETVTTIGSSAFAYCRSLRSVNFEGVATGLRSISKDCFSFCSSLTDIRFPYGITSIAQSAGSDVVRPVSDDAESLLPDEAASLFRGISNVEFPSVFTGRIFSPSMTIKS